MKLRIRQKILLYILSVFVLLYIGTIGYVVISSRNSLQNDAYEKASLIALNAAGQVKDFFDKDLSATRTLANAFMVYKDMPPEQWQQLFLKMYEPVLKVNPHVYSIWDSWEFSGFVPGYTKDYGRIAISLHMDEGKVVKQIDERSLDGDSEIYAKVKSDAKEGVWEPYVDQVLVGKKEARVMTTIATPVLIGGKFVGLIGFDVVLEELQSMVEKIRPLEGSYSYLISNLGVIAGHPERDHINRELGDVYDFGDDILKRIQNGEEFSHAQYDAEGNKHVVFFAPIRPGQTDSPWSLALSVPLHEMMRVANRTLYVSLIVGLLGLILFIVIITFVSGTLTRPIQSITASLKRLSQGEISSKLELNITTGDEIEEMAQALNVSLKGLNSKTNFALGIGNQQLNAQLELLGEHDILGKSLLEMRDNLIRAQNDEAKRRAEEEKRTWGNEGFAKFADIIRENSSNLQDLFDEIISNVVKYLNANQAGLFILIDDDKSDIHFELVAAYAWDRKKFLNKRIEQGEGLVGACALEKETILLNEIPSDYVNITSGLGKATPRCIVLVPLKHEDNVLGVIEMASFNMLQQHEVDFLERVGESMASAILSVRVNAKTRQLLEQSQQQAEEMQAQEEEMRQNMEELQATQEEMARKAEEQIQMENEMRDQYEVEIARLKEIIEKNKLKS